MSVMRFVISVFFLLASTHCIDGATLRCYKGYVKSLFYTNKPETIEHNIWSLDNYIEAPLSNPLAIIDSSCIDQSLPTVVYTFGYRGRVGGPATTAMITAYLTKKKRNVVLLNWETEAKSGVLGIPLGYALYAVPNSKKVGVALGEALMKLKRAGLNMTDVHLLGHSLGAHLMGFAGRVARERGGAVARITGLDPARALFEGSFALQTGLDRTCAKFVDIIHSDPDGYGSSRSSGTVDIWPNYVGENSKQPGCPTGSYEMFSPEDLCSHDRSWRYFSEALASPTGLMAVNADDYDSWEAGSYRTDDAIYMGDLTSKRARGNYYLTTEPRSPFGKGVDGVKPDSNQARKRRESVFTKLFRSFR